MEEPKISLHIVTYNSEGTIGACLRAALRQELSPEGGGPQITVYDNASADGTREIVRRDFGGRVRLVENSENCGFATAHNQGFADAVRAGAEFVLILNPDVALEKEAVRALLEPLRHDSRAGVSCPKLLRAADDLTPLSPAVLDSAGMYITPEIRHLDRGAGEPDKGQFEALEYVFGASGAAALFRRECLLDSAIPAVTEEEVPRGAALPVFDDAFFAYREDADLAWRLNWLGWKTLYQPQALGYHVRKVVPERRGSLPDNINCWSVRNRFLLQYNNLSLAAHGWWLVLVVWRNLLVIGAVLLREKSSIPGLRDALRLFPRGMRRRSELFRRRRESLFGMRRWFAVNPAVEPALEVRRPDGEQPRVQTVTAVIVSYCSGGLTRRCLEVLQAGAFEAPPDYELRYEVVDNSPEGHPEALTEPLPGNALLHRHPENLGFAGAINAVLFSTQADALLVLNSDIELSCPQLTSLVAALESFPQAAAASPILCDETGKPQHGFTVRRFPTFSSVLTELFMLHRLIPKNPWTLRYLGADDRFLRAYLEHSPAPAGAPYDSPELPLIIEQPAGACMLLRREPLLRLGGFDTGFYPAWFEDVDFFKRLRGSGQLAAIDGGAKVFHRGGVTKDLLPAETYFRYWYGNLLRYWKKHGSPWEYGALRVLVPFCLLLRAGIFSLGSLVAAARKREEQAAKLKTTAGGLLRVSQELMRQ